MDNYNTTSEDEDTEETKHLLSCDIDNAPHYQSTAQVVLVSEDLCSQRGTDVRIKIPYLIWCVIKVACVFHQKVLVVNRRCFHCQVQHACESTGISACTEMKEKALLRNYFDFSGHRYYESGDTESDERKTGNTRIQNSNGYNCILCSTYWWNYDGMVRRYTDADLGVGSWNHMGSWLLSVLITFAAIVAIMFDACYYLGALWGQQEQIINFMSYGTFMLNLFIYPFLNMLGKIRNARQSNHPQVSWSTALNDRFIIKRIQFLDIQHRGVPGKMLLLFGVGCVIFHTAYRSFIYRLICVRFSLHSGISVFCGSVIMLMLVAFHYLMYLTRLSFQRQFYLIRNFIEIHQGDLDKCRHILASAFQDFNCYRQFIAVFMTVLIPTLTWAVTTHISWQYIRTSHETQIDNSTSKAAKNAKDFETHINILIWQEIVMFLVLGVWSSGGVDVSYMWKRLHFRLLMIPRKAGNLFWHKMIRHMNMVNEYSNRLNITMIFSLIGFFMALDFGINQVTTLVVREPYCDV